MALCLQRLMQDPECRKRLSLLVESVANCRQTHQPTQFQSRQLCNGGGEVAGLRYADPGFLSLAVDIDLDTNVQVFGVAGPVFREALRDLETVDRVNPLKMLGYSLCLVGLQVSDKMPPEVIPGGTSYLFQPLLNEILAEVPLPGRSYLENGLQGLLLADSNKPNIVCCPPGICCSFRQQILDFTKVFRDSNHVLLRVLRYTRQPTGPGYGKSDQPLPRVYMAVDVAQLLSFTVKNNASDLHLSGGVPPMIRVDGDIKRINMPALTHKDVNSMVYDIMNDKQRKDYEEFLETDFSFEIPKLARFRVNAFNQNRGSAAVFRTIPSEILSLDDLGAPAIFKDISMHPRGIVLVTGPTGSGKSTTLAAMVDYINENKPDHILTIEDPIEFVHESKKSLINQREVHRDTLGFNEALRSALREDPDVILVGELRDLETIRLALTGAETGHLVFGTLHTSSAAKTIDRIVDVFPAAEKEMVRAMLSESLRAVISQTLLKKIGGGRIAAHEIMMGTPAIRNLIREGKIAQMYSAIQTGQNVGMQTLDQNLAELMSKGLINKEEARFRAVNKENF